MSRKKQLLIKAQQILTNDNRNSLSTRKHRLFSMKRVIDGLFVIRIVPATWYGVQTKHIHELVRYWHSQQLKSSTIMNYLVDLRYFLELINHPLDLIDNKSLKLFKPRNDQKPQLNQKLVLSQIKEPLAYLQLSLQMHFGLTYHEAINLVPSIHVSPDGQAVWITREISTNHKDRIVPLYLAAQHQLITQLRELTDGGKQSLTQSFGASHLRLAYNFALSTLQISTQINYRYLYAKSRFKHLLHVYPAHEAKKIIISETHINQTSTIWKSINE